MLEKKRHLHFIGVGGYGMSALAGIALSQGHSVSGSDLRSNKFVQHLIDQGLNFFRGHSRENIIDLPVDFVIYSSAIKLNNPELDHFRQNGVPFLTRGEALGLFCSGKRSIAVAGMHGKTTTTSMIAHIFQCAGLSPTVIVGGEMLDSGTNALAGNGDWLITEADESDASLLYLKPEISVVTNIEEEHMDFYASSEEIESIFEKFLCCTTHSAVLCYDNEVVRSLGSRMAIPCMSYGLDHFPVHLSAKNISSESGFLSFDLLYGETALIPVKLKMSGRHNVLNALASLAASLCAGLPLLQAAESLATFKGVARRMELLADAGSIRVYDDYAHHPTEVLAVLTALKNSRPESRLIAIFQPHRYSRFNYFQDAFADSLAPADSVVLTEIYGAGELNSRNVSASDLLPVLKGRNMPVSFIPRISDIPAYVMEKAGSGDTVVTLGAGSITETAREIAGLIVRD
ncbi:MAG: UDP-N-acetylmuramate--L-alanine ligase [Candidatus Wallbacteria bacterium]|nr:UDP-N-acetylmuramate--L-alanine ligase [Candidatus Wallbacteria bacterium]